MTRAARWPLAAACLALGMLGGFLANQRLIGQNVVPDPAAPRDPASYRDVVKRVLPAVVSIEGKLPAAAPSRTVNTKGGGEDPSPPDADPGFGSGVLIHPSGVVLTNNHVVQNAETVEVTLADGRKFVSRDIRRDPKTDLAVIRLTTAAPLPWLELADSDAVEVGDRVLAVGAPFGLTGSVTHGIVSAKGRYNLRFNQYEDFIQTDAAVNPGNSGGPLIGTDGKVVGITSAIKTRSGGFQGIALAISSNLSRAISDQLLKTGVVRRGYIGVSVKDVTADLAAKFEVPAGGGVFVTRVKDGGPAAAAKVEAGDVIVSVGGRPVRDTRDLQRVVSILSVGQPAEVGVVRAGAPLALQVLVEEQAEDKTATRPPESTPAAPPPGALSLSAVGLDVTDLTAEFLAARKLPAGTRGAVIASVARRSLAETSGLTRGLVVVKVDKTPVGSKAALRDAIARADRSKGALLQVLRPNGETDFVLLRLQ